MMKIDGYTHAVVEGHGDSTKIVTICNGWIEAHNYLNKNWRPDRRIVGLNNIRADIRELRKEEAEAR